MGRFHRLREIESLAPERDYEQIYRLSTAFEFPWDYLRSLEFALFRTYAVPSIADLLATTREFERRPQKRYDDTALLMAQMAEHGMDSPLGKEALRKINRMHGQFSISNEDMLYVLSTFVYEPIAWLHRYGWRPLSGNEQAAAYFYYREIGKRMGIRDIPGSTEEFAQFKVDYEQKHFRLTENTHKIGGFTVGLMASWYPRFLSPIIHRVVYAMMDDPLREAMGYPKQPAWLVRSVEFGLRTRGRIVRLLPVRKTSRLVADPGNRSYPGWPEGYSLGDLGTLSAESAPRQQ
ncbi:DUF2236 domain-containing protein [Pseudonocardiaceae bacterium YIM PH 21723]|nr:DUF2236 domain-containing protein [Pseudonocardiaceae bacterium YIM PH 21723]